MLDEEAYPHLYTERKRKRGVPLALGKLTGEGEGRSIGGHRYSVELNYSYFVTVKRQNNSIGYVVTVSETGKVSVTNRYRLSLLVLSKTRVTVTSNKIMILLLFTITL
jgi:hypothetical protein